MDDIRVYTYEQNGRIYERDGSAGDLAGDFRTLNGELAAAVRPQEEWRPERRMRERYIPDSSQGK